MESDHEKLLDGQDRASFELPRLSQARAHPSRWSYTTTLSWILNIVLALTTLTATTLLLSRRTPPPLQANGDINGIAPHFDQHIVTFQPEEAAIRNLHTPSFEASTKDFWLSLVPKGLGFLHIPDYKNHPDLPAPYIKHDRPNYSASVTHQLHCLYGIMRSYNKLLTEGSPPEEQEHQDHHEWHVGHCFDYLRQGIMCSGDTALEGAETTFPDGVSGTDGWGVKHVCKDYGQVVAWLEEMRMDNRTWI